MGIDRFLGKVDGERFILSDEEFHHAKVKRVKKNQHIEINDLKGNIYLGIVEDIGKKYIKGRILEKLSAEEDEFYLELFLGMPNRLSKVDELIEPISQLGVSCFIPVITKNTAVKGKDILKKIPKWEKIALNSIKQCKRLFPIEIKKPVHIKDIKTDSEKRIVFYEREKEFSLKKEKISKIKTVSIFIGAEGGITEDEIRLLKEKGFKSASLGRYTLKMEIAVITGICQVNFVYR
ncbi:16S rRNA (uracil1498-N3)-methyltransferase [Persephonella hydrogeniphila]|uniref:Ribosomal RNA small subunit methyltransferase E n=1 Tax=Persephonella hydrogeniphila TaxID=198703 RepID=A0A285NFZ1_9AQUI|nr:RsmE family RNA methyltransferase [Persephonella hydrogeniphila]SNZ07887.1 16S rRNA (uracil1498-N3)-methyltransferase [Persephonella hydrogeniphila]